MTEQDLRQALSEFGNVVSVRILRDQDKRSRGVGFARMNDKKQCQEIIDQFHNKTFPSLFFSLNNNQSIKKTFFLLQ
jgi:RNA recognition motif-containing protein